MWKRSRPTSPRDSPFYAGSVVRRIVTLTRMLEKFPLAGRKVPEFEDENLRKVIAYSYRIIYRVEAAESTENAIWKARRSESPLAHDISHQRTEREARAPAG